MKKIDGMTLVFLLVLSVLLLILLSFLIRIFERVFRHRRQSLTTAEFLSFMPGLKRHDIEEILRNSDLWDCTVCAFQNVVNHGSTCKICGTHKDTRLQETPHEMLECRSKVSRPGSSSFQRIASAFFQKILYPDDLSAQQRNARLRRQFTRQLNKHGSVRWHTNFDRSKSFIVYAHPKPTHEETLDTPYLPLSSPHYAYAPGTFSWLQLSDTNLDARSAPNGQLLSRAFMEPLIVLSSLTFSLKYAWFVQQGSLLLTPNDTGILLMKTRRRRVFQEALENLINLETSSLCKVFRVHFINESALDAGAIQREWYSLVAEGLLRPSSGLFVVSNRSDHSYFINSNYEHSLRYLSRIHHLDSFRATGRFIGRALLDGQMLPLHFSPVLFKLLLGIPVTLDDVESLDKTIYSSMRYILDNDNVDDLCLTFSATEMQGNHVVEIDLIENGRDIAVTDQNKLKYVDLMTKWLLFDRIKEPLQEMILGLYEIVPPELLIPFDHKEFELILCGLTEIDISDWKVNTVVSTNLMNSSVLEWFWETLEALSPQDQAKLLQFSTGSSRVPVQGFKGLTSYDGQICYFTLKGISFQSGRYPCAHACYNRIDLPLYPRKSMLQEAITMILVTDPTGFTIE